MADNTFSFLKEGDMMFPSQYYAQDAQNLDAIFDINHEKPLELKEEKLMSKKNKNSHLTKKPKSLSSASSSFVIRNEREKGKHLIKIMVHSLQNNCVQSEPSVSVQYLVKDSYDDILNSTERLINKIVNKISDSNIFYSF